MRIERGAPLEQLPRARRAVLVAIKGAKGASAAELGSSLGLSATAVRCQLQRLREDGLVRHRPESLGRGRPVHRYALTPSGEALFPKRYEDLTAELLGYLGGPGAHDVDMLFEQRCARRLGEARRRLAGLGFDAQVTELSGILDEDGYMAEFERLEDGQWRITEHNCAIVTVATGYPRACSSELKFIGAALPGVRVKRVAHLMDGSAMCAYEVTTLGHRHEMDK